MLDRTCGAELADDGVCRWTLWAPRADVVELVLFEGAGPPVLHAMTRAADGLHRCELPGIRTGQRYAFRLDGGAIRPDPASRWQPDGVHAPSAVWNPDACRWTDAGWKNVSPGELAIYELHIGAFTSGGTFDDVIPRLEDLVDLGVTAIELMPVGQFPGAHDWGYDGVYWYAAQNGYGGPDGLQRLVDACHAHGLAVILDVIYNHLGPEGNYLRDFGPYFTDRYSTPWGEAINFDDPDSEHVRRFVLENIRYWLSKFHLDGLRLDAVHAIYDSSRTHILAEMQRAATEVAERRGWPAYVIAESNLNDVRLLDEPSAGGYGLHAQWNDDFHHCVHALLTGERDGYYVDFDDPASQLVKALNRTFVHDGCYSAYRGRPHGSDAGEHSGDRFVISVQTHDQVGNRARGDRFGTLLTPAQQRLAAGLMLLSPYVPMLFMGEEYGETHPFPFFCDFGDESLREAVRKGRCEEFADFAWMGELPDPNSPDTFAAAVLSWDWSRNPVHAGLRWLYQILLALRKNHPAMQDFENRDARLRPGPNGAAVLRLFRGRSDRPSERLLAVFNLGGDFVDAGIAGEVCTRFILSSDESWFGGQRTPTTFDGRLSPFAFAVFDSLEEDV